MRVLNCGDSGVLVEVADLAQALALQAALDENPIPGVVEAVPAARTVLLRVDPGSPGGVRAVAEAARRLHPRPGDLPRGGEVEIGVQYDGADLGEVAEITGMTEREVVRAHTSARWTVAFGGFAPGFGYLVGDDRRLDVPRRGESRTRVPAGSVALAGGFGGVYPRSSPGGWRLLGHTDAVVWDLDRDPPGLLVPGTRVRFHEV
ncbi:allophanate hydrolase subunit 1 [Nocardiopsis sp. RSe5-2]|uniref:Allophanate hydrolase subunit 1 n=1 Tax=Nocardiopsis endophytica TaxID=3018445 RepID=A0ABT4U763_9ACTN|nr:allophanate hydrolase subunit 1 [Nocardiopsis endophytica]MDA2812785.1 allophanate hydrolase subunit 1 [Nocardiopsis endophytica]